MSNLRSRAYAVRSCAIRQPFEAITNFFYLAKLEAHTGKGEVLCTASGGTTGSGPRGSLTLSFYPEQRRAHEVDVVELLESACASIRDICWTSKSTFNDDFLRRWCYKAIPGSYCRYFPI